MEDRKVKERLESKINMYFSPDNRRGRQMPTFSASPLSATGSRDMKDLQYIISHKNLVGEHISKKERLASDSPIGCETPTNFSLQIKMLQTSPGKKSPLPQPTSTRAKSTVLLDPLESPSKPSFKRAASNSNRVMKKLIEYNKRVQDLYLSTQEKERLLKRKEVIKSMKFLRITGQKLREEMAKALKRKKSQTPSQNSRKSAKASPNKLKNIGKMKSMGSFQSFI